MAQTQFVTFKQPLTSFLDNRKYLGILEPARYRGFDTFTQTQIGPGNKSTISLLHTQSGIKQTKLNATQQTDFTGIILTRQGVVIQEDASISVIVNHNINAVASGGTTNPRIDLIILEHEYLDSVGGQPATYSVIQGNPSPSPVAPSLSNPKTQIIIGQIFLPANTTDLTAAGVIYTKTVTPNIANDSRLENIINIHTADIFNIKELNDIQSIDIDDILINAAFKNQLNVYTKRNEFRQGIPDDSVILDHNPSLGQLIVPNTGNLFIINTNDAIFDDIEIEKIQCVPEAKIGTEISLMVTGNTASKPRLHHNTNITAANPTIANQTAGGIFISVNYLNEQFINIPFNQILTFKKVWDSFNTKVFWMLTTPFHESWRESNLLDGHVNVSPGFYYKFAFKKDTNNNLWLRGTVQNPSGTVGGKLFILGAEYRPNRQIEFFAPSISTSFNPVGCIIQDTGNIVTGLTNPPNNPFHLNGFIFPIN